MAGRRERMEITQAKLEGKGGEGEGHGGESGGSKVERGGGEGESAVARVMVRAAAARAVASRVREDEC